MGNIIIIHDRKVNDIMWLFIVSWYIIIFIVSWFYWQFLWLWIPPRTPGTSGVVVRPQLLHAVEHL
jgi:ABC-type Mn2+/Zn2+ transport system permease subunit